MTMVAGCRFQDGVVIIADSRVTWERSTTNIYSDSAQKILFLERWLTVAFAGNVDLANHIVREICKRMGEDSRLKNPRNLSTKLSRTAKFYYRKYSEKCKDGKCSVSLLLGGVETTGAIFLWAYEPPDFVAQEVKSGYVMIGSGAVAEPYLRSDFERIDAEENSLKNKADRLRMGLEFELQGHGIDTVGGLFQEIILSSEGIFPITYGFMNLNPEDIGDAKEIITSEGAWIQKDLAKNKKIKLVNPKTILKSSPKENRFHDYGHSKVNGRALRWYLNHFFTSLKVSRKADKIEFEGMASQIGSFEYPTTIPVVASLGFWGPQGDYPLKIYIDDCVNKTLIYEKNVRVEPLGRQAEIDVLIELHVQKPGPHFLECYVTDSLLARRAVYFGQLLEAGPNTKEKCIAYKERFNRELVEQHSKCVDPELEGNICYLAYFIICESFSCESGKYKFFGETQVVFWKKYPLRLKRYFASALRFSKGRHVLRIDLVSAATHEVINAITSITVEETSECIITPVYGKFIAKIPEPGFYFFNLYVDDQFVSSILLIAETDKPKYSYSLCEEGLKRVMAGELLVLAKRSREMGTVNIFVPY